MIENHNESATLEIRSNKMKNNQDIASDEDSNHEPIKDTKNKAYKEGRESDCCFS